MKLAKVAAVGLSLAAGCGGRAAGSVRGRRARSRQDQRRGRCQRLPEVTAAGPALGSQLSRRLSRTPRLAFHSQGSRRRFAAQARRRAERIARAAARHRHVSGRLARHARRHEAREHPAPRGNRGRRGQRVATRSRACTTPPSSASHRSSAPWAWRFEGHHLSINVTELPGEAPVVAPLFMGANPARVLSGPECRLSIARGRGRPGPRDDQDAARLEARRQPRFATPHSPTSSLATIRRCRNSSSRASPPRTCRPKSARSSAG